MMTSPSESTTYARKYYSANRDRLKAQASQRNARRRDRNRRIRDLYLSARPCTDCDNHELMYSNIETRTKRKSSAQHRLTLRAVNQYIKSLKAQL